MELLEAASAILLSFQALSDELLTPPKPRGWQTRGPVQKMKYQLNRHSNNFKETIDSLLGPFADEEAELAELCDNPLDEKWRDGKLSTAIHEEYARLYKPIQDILEKMRTLLDDIQTGIREIDMPLEKRNHLLNNRVSFLVVQYFNRE